MKQHLADKAATVEPGRARRGTGPALSEMQPGATPHPILQLQGTIGNQAVNRLLQSGKLQTMLMVSRSGDTPVQRQESDEAERLQSSDEALQKQSGSLAAPPAQHPNRTGLPDHLKSGIESLSGLSMDDVRVHYNSAQPARLNALAYTQGTDIHVAPGQEKHLPHEAWHVVQQAQGRVQPTMQMKDGVPINDDQRLEHEAEVMGEKALQMGRSAKIAFESTIQTSSMKDAPLQDVLQRNAFLDSISNPQRQIDYTAISANTATADQKKFFGAISDALGKNLRRQALFEAMDDAGYGIQFLNYVQTVGWGPENLVSFGQDIRSSHSGGAIDPELPQSAYEAAPVAGGGLVVSVAPPVHGGLAGSANYAWLEASTTKHTTDPDAPEFRGPTALGGPKPTLGATVGGGVGANNRLPEAPGRVASYFELGAHNIHRESGEMLVSGTRLVYDPFAKRYFVSEHYDKQYELINVPLPRAQQWYAGIINAVNSVHNNPKYQAANLAQQQAIIEKNIFVKVLNKIVEGG